MTLETTYTVYRVYCASSGLSYYGLTTQSLPDRWRGHVASRHSSKNPLHVAIATLGSQAFAVDPVFVTADCGEGRQRERDEIEANGYWPQSYNAMPRPRGQRDSIAYISILEAFPDGLARHAFYRAMAVDAEMGSYDAYRFARRTELPTLRQAVKIEIVLGVPARAWIDGDPVAEFVAHQTKKD